MIQRFAYSLIVGVQVSSRALYTRHDALVHGLVLIVDGRSLSLSHSQLAVETQAAAERLRRIDLVHDEHERHNHSQACQFSHFDFYWRKQIV
jgi:hypothetical protein